METLHVFLPVTMKQYVEERVSMGDYNSESDYMRDLIRKDQTRRAQERLEAMLLRGLESPANEWTEESVSFVKNAVRERLAANREDT